MQFPCCITKCEYFPQVHHVIYRLTGCGMNLQQNLELSVLRYGRCHAHFIDYTGHRMHNECKHSWTCRMFSDGRCKCQGSRYTPLPHIYTITIFPIYAFISVITDWVYVRCSHSVRSRYWHDDSEEPCLLFRVSVPWRKGKKMQGRGLKIRCRISNL